MEISTQQVLEIARLARLGIGPEEAARHARDLGRVLEYVEKISRVDTEGVPPGSQPGGRDCRMREDAVRPGLDREAALGAAPDPVEGLFRVPAVLPNQEGEPTGGDHD